MKRAFLLLFMVLLLSGCGGSYPYDNQYSDDADLAQEIREGREEVENEPDWRAEQYDSQAKDDLEFDSEPPIPGTNLLKKIVDTEATRRTQASEPAKDNCVIKGNISMGGEKIYHLPGQRYYNATVIEPSAGERWFCTEEEAKQNGWRKSKK